MVLTLLRPSVSVCRVPEETANQRTTKTNDQSTNTFAWINICVIDDRVVGEEGCIVRDFFFRRRFADLFVFLTEKQERISIIELVRK